jgi:cytochrome P450
MSRTGPSWITFFTTRKVRQIWSLQTSLTSRIDPKEVRDELLNILFAARDTTTSLFTWITYIFATHPQVMERARNEVIAIAPENRSPSMADLRQMRYRA